MARFPFGGLNTQDLSDKTPWGKVANVRADAILTTWRTRFYVPGGRGSGQRGQHHQRKNQRS